MTAPTPDEAEESLADQIDNIVPTGGFGAAPLIGLGGSAGSIPALQKFLQSMPPDSGLAFVVVVHLSPNHESNLAQLLQHTTQMRVMQVQERQRIEPDHVYVIPPGRRLLVADGSLELAALPPGRGANVAVDLFFRTLADTHGPHAVGIVLSGADGDGANGIKRIKERGGLTIAQDPEEAEIRSMPSTAISSGMVDWVLPVGQMAPRVLDYFRIEHTLELPPEQGPARADAPSEAAEEETALRDICAFVRTRTGRDFSNYKRATVVRRIGRRMQVNGITKMPEYLSFLRTRPAEAAALLQDLLISVTNFFRDPDCFSALENEIPTLLRGKGPKDCVRVWVAACATGEEAYSIAMLLAEHARGMDAPPAVQVFATDLNADAIQVAREGIYPTAIEADVDPDRLKRFFLKEHRGYRVRRELRQTVLFAVHDVLKDSPFSRVDLVSCRNLLIYLDRGAQARVFQTFHFALVPGGRMFLGASESVDEGSPLFVVTDKKHRLYQHRPTPRSGLPVPNGPGTLALSLGVGTAQPLDTAQVAMHRPLPHLDGDKPPLPVPADSRTTTVGDLHLRLLDLVAPPSVLVDAEYDIVHLSPAAGRFLQFSGGQPSRNLLRCVNPSLRIELRAALYEAARKQDNAEVLGVPVQIEGQSVAVTVRVVPARDMAGLFLVVFQSEDAPSIRPARGGPEGNDVAHRLDRELERLKLHLRDTVEQYEASTEELKASNEELQAMNEELRSATEELETSREELQSINEELTTVNHELKSKVEELGHANSDMHNLMDATPIATVFLDRELRITRYTPPAVSLFNLIPSDTGRPLTDLKMRLNYPSLGADALRVLDKLVPIEREVGEVGGGWYLARLMPYRTVEDRIGGVVLSFVDITERKQAEEMRLWLAAVVSASSDAIISFSLDGTILTWNQGAERIFGYTAGDAIGQVLAMLEPSGQAGEQDAVARLTAAEPGDSYETVCRRKDGTALDVAITISPIRDAKGHIMAGTAIMRDITAAKRAEQALRESEEQLRLLMENATEFAIFALDLDRRVTLWNAGAQRLLGYSGDEIVGHTGDVIFTPQDRQAGAPQDEVSTALAEGRASDDRLHLRKDGTSFWASGACMPMRNAEGQAVGFVKILRDQTAARQSRQALEDTQAELLRALAENERAREALETADAAKDRFLAVLSHELRNPLASITSAAEVLMTSTIPADQRQAAGEVVQRQSSRMKMLLDDLLDVSRLKLGRLRLKTQPVQLSAVMDSALEATQPMQEEAGHVLTVEMPPEPIELEADPLRIAQVVSNLLSNAYRYTPSGGKVDVRVSLCEGGEVEIAVSDNGIGMEPERIEDMFEMFAQADKPQDHSPNLGIGLALVKNIVELHGGRVSAESAGLGRGSTFRVRLPGARVAGGSDGGDGSGGSGRSEGWRGPDRPAGIEPPRTRPKGGRRVLVADDNVDAAWGLATLLEAAGFEVLRVHDGKQAVSEIARARPDVAIVDIGMPGLDGHAVAQQVRASPHGARIVLIAATGWGQEADQSRSRTAGFDAHVTKPLNIRELRPLMEKLMEARAAAHG